MTDHPARAALVAVGDIMLGDSSTCVGFGFHSRYPLDASPALVSARDVLQRGQIVFGNLECLLTREGLGATRYRTEQMRGDPEYASQLREAGFTAISIANNHAMQHGIRGFEATIDNLRAADIDCVGMRGDDGWTAAPVVQTTSDGKRVGILGYSWRPRQYDAAQPPYAEGDVAAVEFDVRRLRALADFVVVSLHWGEEFVSEPSVDEVASAHRIIDSGASVVLGHHPHVVRPVEVYANGIICYSLGNFVTDMLWQPQLRDGVILECDLDSAGTAAPRLYRSRTNGDYVAELQSIATIATPSPIAALEPAAYRAAIARTVRQQRIAAYRYTARNLRRFPFPVLLSLLATTLRNKLLGLPARLFARRRPSPGNP